MSLPAADETLRELRRIRTSAELYVVHYACESTLATAAGPPEVSAIGFHNIVSRTTRVFSQADFDGENELSVLRSYFAFLRDGDGRKFIHWRMNQVDYGFSALERRFHRLAKEIPYQVPGDRTFSLAELVASSDQIGVEAIPKLKQLFVLNELTCKYMLEGADEAARVKSSDHAAVRASIGEKVELLGELVRRCLDGDLETARSGKRIHFADATLDPVATVARLGARFRAFHDQLKRRHNGRTSIELSDEYDHQDIFHAMLRLFFEDVRAEEAVPSQSGANSRIDFLLPKSRLAVELKHAKTLSDAALGGQLEIDVARYKAHPGVRQLVCLVFDYDRKIKNPSGIEADMTSVRDGIYVTVRILQA